MFQEMTKAGIRRKIPYTTITAHISDLQKHLATECSTVIKDSFVHNGLVETKDQDKDKYHGKLQKCLKGLEVEEEEEVQEEGGWSSDESLASLSEEELEKVICY